MTRLIPIDTDTMEAVAHKHGLEIELSDTDARLRLDGITFVAQLGATGAEEVA